MADRNTETTCELLTIWNDDPNVIDYWTFSHQFVPFFVTIYGVDYRWIIIFVYFYETIENAVWCVQKEYQEDFANSTIADPLQGILGIVVGLAYLKLIKSKGINNDKDYFNRYRHNVILPRFDFIVDLVIICVPSLIFAYTGSEFVYFLYLLLFPLSYWLISYLNHKRESLENHNKVFYRFNIVFFYMTFLLFFNIVHPFEINSFYAEFIIGILFGATFFGLAIFNEKRDEFEQVAEFDNIKI